METMILHPKNEEQVKALKAFAKALKIEFSIQKGEKIESPYDPEFVAKINKAEQEIKGGKFVEMSLEQLKELCG
jgi:hypothetical protein